MKAITRATSSGKEGSEETSIQFQEEEDTDTVPVVRYGHQAAEKYSEIAEDSSIPTTNTEAFDLFHNLEAKLDSEDTSSVLLLGGGSLIAVWIAAVLVGAIDSIPLFPKLMEVVGLAYTLWFSTRYLLFKKNREELVVKIEEIKEQVLGSRNGD